MDFRGRTPFTPPKSASEISVCVPYSIACFCIDVCKPKILKAKESYNTTKSSRYSLVIAVDVPGSSEALSQADCCVVCRQLSMRKERENI